MPAPTIGFDRVIQRAAIHAFSSSARRSTPARCWWRSSARRTATRSTCSGSRAIERLDVIQFLCHGVARDELGRTRSDAGVHRRGRGGRGGAAGEGSARGLRAWTCVGARRGGQIDPLIGREPELERTIQVLCRRRKNNPLYVGEPGRGQDRHRRGAGAAHPRGQGARGAPGRARSSRSTWARCSPAPATAATSSSASRRCSRRSRSIPDAILFIDEIHTVVGAGAVSGGSDGRLEPAQARAGVRRAALHRLHHLRRVQGLASIGTRRWRAASRRST